MIRLIANNRQSADAEFTQQSQHEDELGHVLELAVNLTGLGIWVWDEVNRRILSASREFTDIYGVKSKTSINTSAIGNWI